MSQYQTFPDIPIPTLASWDGSVGKHHSITFPSSNEWGFPDLVPYKAWYGLPTGLVAYNDMGKAALPEGSATHFFLQDNKFESVWTFPKRSIARIKQATDLVIGPDFSQFIDYPLVVQQYNKYRNHWVTALWQAEGIRVIPNVCWSDYASFEWAFVGVPEHSVVAVGTAGCARNPVLREAFMIGYRAMLDTLYPTDVIVYGREIRGMKVHGINLHTFQTTWQGVQR